MKKFLILALLTLIIVLSGCSSSNNLTVDAVLAAFTGAGLDGADARKMTKDDFGIGPMKADEAKIFKLPSACSDCNGRVLSYDNQEDLDQMKKYYDDLGKESAMLFSWTIKNDNILVQLSGDLKEDQYNKYKEVLDGLDKN